MSQKHGSFEENKENAQDKATFWWKRAWANVELGHSCLSRINKPKWHAIHKRMHEDLPVWRKAWDKALVYVIL